MKFLLGFTTLALLACAVFAAQSVHINPDDTDHLGPPKDKRFEPISTRDPELVELLRGVPSLFKLPNNEASFEVVHVKQAWRHSNPDAPKSGAYLEGATYYVTINALGKTESGERTGWYWCAVAFTKIFAPPIIFPKLDSHFCIVVVL